MHGLFQNTHVARFTHENESLLRSRGALLAQEQRIKLSALTGKPTVENLVTRTLHLSRIELERERDERERQRRVRTRSSMRRAGTHLESETPPVSDEHSPIHSALPEDRWSMAQTETTPHGRPASFTLLFGGPVFFQVASPARLFYQTRQNLAFFTPFLSI